jgi:hypothetical protein
MEPHLDDDAPVRLAELAAQIQSSTRDLVDPRRGSIALEELLNRVGRLVHAYADAATECPPPEHEIGEEPDTFDYSCGDEDHFIQESHGTAPTCDNEVVLQWIANKRLPDRKCSSLTGVEVHNFIGSQIAAAKKAAQALCTNVRCRHARCKVICQQWRCLEGTVASNLSVTLYLRMRCTDAQ